MAKKRGNLIGSWAFLVGVVLAVVLGLFVRGPVSSNWVFVLVVAGLLIGLLNIADEETTPFLFSGTVLIIASAFGMQPLAAVPSLASILYLLLILFVPATIIVALKNVFVLARR